MDYSKKSTKDGDLSTDLTLRIDLLRFAPCLD